MSSGYGASARFFVWLLLVVGAGFRGCGGGGGRSDTRP